MASPIAHSLAGVCIYLISRRRLPENKQDLWWLILAANFPDLDLIPGLLMGNESLFHRTFSHSIFSALVFSLAVYLISYRYRRQEALRFTLLMLLAYLSQLVIDWISYDGSYPQGIMALWPMSHEYYMSETTVFLNVRRDNFFSLPILIHNAKAIALELIILGSITIGLLCWRKNKL